MNGYAATFGVAFEMRRSSDDLPAFGNPTSAASASSFRRSSYSFSSPGRPVSAKRGVCRVEVAKRRFPRPAATPCEHDAGCPLREVGDELAVLIEDLGSGGHTQLDARAVRPVPAGAAAVTTTAGREPPLRAEARGHGDPRRRPRPRPAGPAVTAVRPAFGHVLLRRKLSAPSPPRPAFTWMRARSWNIAR